MPHVRWVDGAAGRMSPGLWYLTKMRGLVHSHACDLYWGAQQTIPPGLSRKIPVVLTFYDLVVYFHPESMRLTARLQQRSLLNYSVARADRIVSISAQTQNDMIQKFNYPEAKARVGLLGYEGATVRPVKGGKKNTALPDHIRPDRFIFAVSTIEPRKNYPVLLQAYKEYAAKAGRSAYDLVIAGRRGWESPEFFLELDQFAAESGKLHVLADLPDAAIEALYSSCAFFCIPSLYEGFGLSLLEALCHQKPSIASNIGCLREIGGDRVTYVNARDAAAWRDAITEAATMHAKGKLKSPRFPAKDWTWERTARVYRDTFAELV